MDLPIIIKKDDTADEILSSKEIISKQSLLKDAPAAKDFNKEIDLNIKYLIEGDFDHQIESISFFERQLRYNDIKLPLLYLEISFNIFKAIQDNVNLVDLFLAFYRHCTAFPSEMQKFLTEKVIIDEFIKFFPNINILSILGNLALSNPATRNYLLSIGILDNLIPIISIFEGNEGEIKTDNKDLITFDYALNLLNCLIDHKNFDFSQWEVPFIHAFDVLHSTYPKLPYKNAKQVARAFSDYVDAHPSFIESFKEKCQLKIFMDREFEKENVYTWVSEIILSFIDTYSSDGVNIVLEFGVLNWVGKRIFSSSQKVVIGSFSILTEIIQNIEFSDFYSLMIDLIQNNFLEKARDKYYSNASIRLKIALYRFVCTLFSNSPLSQVPYLINEKALDLIVDEIEILEESQDDWPIILFSLQRLLPFRISDIDEEEEEDIDDEEKIVNRAILNIKGNDYFINWLENYYHQSGGFSELRDAQELFDVFLN